jgi:hypothetical protein
MSTPDWWGNWRPSLPAHTGDLQPTDLIECTSIVSGVPVNTAITGQQIIDAAQGGGGSTSWGNIGGTLSNQTDLQTALNAKQATLVSGTNIKTVNGNSLLGSGNLTITGGSGLVGYHNIMGFFPSGSGTSAHVTASTPAQITTSPNLIYQYPFIPQNSITYSSIRFNVVTASAGVNARVLIYSNSGGLPNTKIYESADISCATSGIKTITTSGTFTAGTITWIGIQVSGSPVLTALSLTACLPIAFSVITGAPTTAWSYTYAYGSAPATLNQAFRSSYANILPIIQFIQ